MRRRKWREVTLGAPDSRRPPPSPVLLASSRPIGRRLQDLRPPKIAGTDLLQEVNYPLS